jgi:hypothetical protein
MVFRQINYLSGASEPEFGEPGVIRRARPRQPVKFSLRRENGHIVDASFAATHQAIRMNSHCSLPYARNQLLESSCHSY